MNEEFAIHEGKTFQNFFAGVFGWMFIGLLITAVTAWGLLSSGMVVFFLLNPVLIWAFFIGEFILVFYISRMLVKAEVSPGRAKIAFVIYSVINGITLSSIFLVYDIGLIYKAFLGTAITFGIMAVYGYSTKADLSKISSFLVMALIGVLVITLVNYIFSFFGFYSGSLDLVLSYVTFLIFLGLTAWDTQKLKYMYNGSGSTEVLETASIVGALSLYLDFINLFLSLLRISSRD